MRVLIVLCCVLTLHALAGPTTSPTTQPEHLSERQASILLQLSNAEANIKAINKALKLTGYKVGLEYDQVEGSQKANELMDRKGGGPVPWDQFYGKTAMDFYHHGSAELHYNAGRGAKTIDANWQGSRLTKVDRPKEFDFIYRANEQQGAKAQEQIASLLQNQAALLARRQKHEMDQSALWASLAWERIADREIAFRPPYRFPLAPAGPRDALLRGPILFLRTLDKATSEAIDTIDVDQPATFTQLRTVTKNAYAALLGTLASATFAQGVSDDDRRQIDAIKSLCKQLTEQSVVADDNFRLAIDSDRAKEDASKLEYRAALQSSLAKFTATVAALDDRLSATADAWGLKPIPGSASPYTLPAKLLNVSPKPAVTASSPATSTAHADGNWTVLFKSDDPKLWNTDANGDAGYAIPLDKAPHSMRYLRIRNDAGRYTIIALKFDELRKNAIGDAAGWEGRNYEAFKSCHLGIIDKSLNRNYINAIDVTQLSGSGWTGWGFGNLVGTGGQGYAWDGHPVPKAAFEIAVTAGDLTAAEHEHVVGN